MKVLVTGGAGYVGSVLVPKLLERGHGVVVFDIGYFGFDHIAPHPELHVWAGDIRNTSDFAAAVADCDAVIHLAAISNDASFELDEALSRTTNLECFEPMVLAAKNAGVKQFIYASSSSVYGVSDAPDVTEDHPLVPLTLYNKYKGMCEPLLLKHQAEDFCCTVIRPATVCGYSPRMRLDLSVNILTNHAINKGKITVFGGEQMRPNLHIQDMCRLYCELLEVPKAKIAGQTFNVGNENLTIKSIAEIVKDECSGRRIEGQYIGPLPIEVVHSQDTRSYHISSAKIANQVGFKPVFSVRDAISDICSAFDRGGIPEPESDRYFNVRTMKALNAQ